MIKKKHWIIISLVALNILLPIIIWVMMFICRADIPSVNIYFGYQVTSTLIISCFTIWVISKDLDGQQHWKKKLKEVQQDITDRDKKILDLEYQMKLLNEKSKYEIVQKDWEVNQLHHQLNNK